MLRKGKHGVEARVKPPYKNNNFSADREAS
jgi:hypothetical protein